MNAWWVDAPGPMRTHPLRQGEREDPEPGRGQIRVRVLTCGVCRTDLHLAEGDLSPRGPLVIPGHEVVGQVDAVGDGVIGFRVGDLAGIAWLRHTCGRCAFCRRGDENLCEHPKFTGWDDDGGYAEYAVIDEQFAYHLASDSDPLTTAPMLCAGIIGYRAYRLSQPRPSSAIGLYGFGASAHLTAQLALHQGHRVHVLTRSPDAQRLALELGVDSAAGAADPPPEPLDAAILFAPAGELVPAALSALAPGGTLAIAGIHLSDIPALNYQDHLFRERVVRSVTANTRRDGEEFLALAAALQLRPTVTTYPFAQAEQALSDLADDRVNGVAVLRVAADA
ncbi:MAG TPA: zinc-dependent alcohol dehydrogenase family protein [Mycobacteriales bacterium]|nr:zinc-dependent alcohol dehydrogenase family protein [Mycobacteriales bacterium]